MAILMAFVGGCCFASFLIVLALNPSLDLKRRSVCDGCGYSLAWHQLIPVLSSLGGRCKCPFCFYQPSRLYGFLELAGGLMAVVNTVLFSGTQQIILQGLVAIGFYTSLVDCSLYRIPIISLPILGVLGSIWNHGHKEFFVSLFILAAILSLLFISWWIFNRQKLPLGIGDVLLLLLGAFWFPPYELPLFLFLTGLGGILTSLMFRFLYQKALFPFAPAIFSGLWGTLLCYGMYR